MADSVDAFDWRWRGCGPSVSPRRFPVRLLGAVAVFALILAVQASVVGLAARQDAGQNRYIAVTE